MRDNFYKDNESAVHFARIIIGRWMREEADEYVYASEGFKQSHLISMDLADAVFDMTGICYIALCLHDKSIVHRAREEYFNSQARRGRPDLGHSRVIVELSRSAIDRDVGLIFSALAGKLAKMHSEGAWLDIPEGAV